MKPHRSSKAAADIPWRFSDALRSLGREEIKDVSRVRHDCADVVKRVIHKRASLRPLVLPSVVEV